MIAIEPFASDRKALRPLFLLADDSPGRSRRIARSAKYSSRARANRSSATCRSFRPAQRACARSRVSPYGTIANAAESALNWSTPLCGVPGAWRPAHNCRNSDGGHRQPALLPARWLSHGPDRAQCLHTGEGPSRRPVDRRDPAARSGMVQARPRLILTWRDKVKARPMRHDYHKTPETRIPSLPARLNSRYSATATATRLRAIRRTIRAAIRQATPLATNAGT
jgi:hypothetical protein